MRSIFDRKNLSVIILLLAVTYILNTIIFSNQLNYGFRDVDWQVLYFFKLYGNLSFNHLFHVVRAVGVYAFESYYVGFLVDFIGVNFTELHRVTHIFKIITAIFVYILILKIFGRRLLAFIASLFYSISYTHAGVLFQLASGGYFLTVIIMILFFITYYHSLLKKNILGWAVVSSILLAIALMLKPERMYPVIFLVLFIECFKLIKKRFSRESLIGFFERTLIIFLPVIIFSFFSRTLFNGGNLHFGPDQFSISSRIRLDSIMKGNLQLLLYPFASIGSIFLFGDYWKIFGQLNFQNFTSYIISLIFGPVLRLLVMTAVLVPFIYRKSLNTILAISLSTVVFGVLIYILNINWQHIYLPERIHFDPVLIATPAIFGFYILVLGLVFLFTLIKTKNYLLAPPVLGIFFAFLFIVLTWIPSDLQLLFMGPQRYLSIPSIGIALFIAGLFVIIYDKLRKNQFTRNFSWLIFLLFIPLIIVNYHIAKDFFDYELTYAGLRGSEQIRMKTSFRQLTGVISATEPSLFYFDETADKENGYFDEGTVIAGFESWTRVNMDGSLNNFPEPGQMRTNIQCPEHTHQNCVEILKSGLATIDGRQGIWYKDPIRGNKSHFYYLSNFHAFRFINKNIVDIKKDVIGEMGLEASSL